MSSVYKTSVLARENIKQVGESDQQKHMYVVGGDGSAIYTYLIMKLITTIPSVDRKWKPLSQHRKCHYSIHVPVT